MVKGAGGFLSLFKPSCLAGALAAGLLAGCAAPIISHDFPGIDSLPLQTATPNPASDPARLFVIHGMTNHDPNYSDKLVEALAARLGLVEVEPTNKLIPVPGAVIVDGKPAAINLRAYALSANGAERLRVTALTWSPLTAPLKHKQFSTDDELPRVPINGAIKRDVIDDGLCDAVLYVGSYGEVMRRAVKMALCEFLDGRFANDDCAAPASSRTPVAFIAESLGSSMLFDGIEALRKTPARQSMLERTQLLFMFANQLPLLQLSDVKPTSATFQAQASLAPVASKLDRFLRSRMAARQAVVGGAPAAQAPIEVVAFTDPSDLLSYPLEHDNAPNDQVINVIYPVATRWLGLFANPLKAHTGYDSDAKVLSLVVCGSAGCAN